MGQTKRDEVAKESKSDLKNIKEKFESQLKEKGFEKNKFTSKR
jgi:hypothetical protein